MAPYDREKPYLRMCNGCGSKNVAFMESEYFFKNDIDGLYLIRLYCYGCNSFFKEEITFPKKQKEWMDKVFMVNMRRAAPMKRAPRPEVKGVFVSKEDCTFWDDEKIKAQHRVLAAMEIKHRLRDAEKK